MAKWKVTVRGLGKIGNNVKNINEEFEVEENVINDLRNTNTKAQVLEGLLLTRLPGVVVEWNKLQLQTEEIQESIFKNKTVQNVGTAAVAGAVGGIIGSKSTTKKKKAEKEENIDNTIPFGDDLKEIANYKWNGDLQNTIDKLKNISIQTAGYKWKYSRDSEIGKENNRILTRCLKQYKIGFKYYKKQTEFKDMKRGLARLERKKFFNKYWGFMIFALVMALSLLLVALG